MKKVNLFFLLLLSYAIVACNEDNYGPSPTILPDTVSPIIALSAPTPNDSILVIDGIIISAEIKDDKLLDKVRVVLTDPTGSSRLLSEHTIAFYLDHRNFSLGEYHRIPKHSAAGEYKVTVEAEDKGQNVTQKAVTFTLHDSDIDSEAFVMALDYILNDVVSGLGYSPWDLGYAFDEVWLSQFLYLMVDTNNEFGISEAEWEKFISDFDVKAQTWATWDENSDGNLDNKEFDDGISRLNFFSDWDTNQNMLVDYEELATGIFTRWDHNQDKLLTKEEYLEKSYTYLYSE